jgi:hypothetical protein
VGPDDERDRLNEWVFRTNSVFRWLDNLAELLDSLPSFKRKATLAETWIVQFRRSRTLRSWQLLGTGFIDHEKLESF